MLSFRTAPCANPRGTERLQVPGTAAPVQGFVCTGAAPGSGALLQPPQMPHILPWSSCRLCAPARAWLWLPEPAGGDKVPPGRGQGASCTAPCHGQVFAQRAAQTNPPWQALAIQTRASPGGRQESVNSPGESRACLGSPQAAQGREGVRREEKKHNSWGTWGTPLGTPVPAQLLGAPSQGG